MTTFLAILGALALSAAIALAFRPLMPATFAAYASLWLFQWSGIVEFQSSTMLFWGVATLLTLGIDRLLPAETARGKAGRGYVGGGALAGMVVGMLMPGAGIVLGTVIGAALGAMAYSRTPEGKTIAFPSSEFVRYLCACGLPTVVDMAIVGVALKTLLATYGHAVS